MTFDMQKARSIVTIGPRGGNWAGRYLDIASVMAAALNEIDRLIHLVDETVIQLSACRSVAKQIQNEQAKRIAELEAATKNMQAIISGDLKYIEAANQKTERQRATLKKLGQEKRARGKALIEERARRTSLVNFSPETRSTNEYRTQPDRMKDVAREQLHREGVI